MPRINFSRSQDLEVVVRRLIELLGLDYIDPDRVFVAVSKGSKSRAYARIWGIPSPFARLGICEPAYVIEVVSENARELDCIGLLKILVHELLHIPKSFSGGLRGHGHWNSSKNVRALLSRLPRHEVEDLCTVARRALEEY
jgi:predicted metallopeptidase